MDENASKRDSRPQSWKQTRRGKTPTYAYKQLKDILNCTSSSKEIHYLYGVVIDYAAPQESKGTDFFCIIRIVDPTACKGEGIKVTLFHEDIEKLPKAEPWNIIRLHRVKTTNFGGQMSLISTRGWSWVMWPGKSEDAIGDGQSCSISYTVLESDRQKVQELRHWIDTNNFQDLSQVLEDGMSGENTKLQDVECGKFFNLLCQLAIFTMQVTGVAKVHENFMVLQVWDGTAPSHPIEPADIPKSVDIETSPAVLELQHLIVDVSVYDNHVQTVEEAKIVPGSFVKFCNLHASKKIEDNVPSSSTDQRSMCSELFLHGGYAFGRELIPVDSDLPEVLSMVELMNTQREPATEAFDRFEDSKSSSGKKHPSSSFITPVMHKKRKLVGSRSGVHSEDDCYHTPPQHPVIVAVSSSSLDRSPIPSDVVVEHLDVADSQPPGQDTLDTLDMLVSLDAPPLRRVSQPYSQQSSATSETVVAESQETDSVIRCHQDSLTVVFGDSSPLAVSSISDVIAAEVPVRTSKLFRIRAQVKRTTDPEQLICYCCPATGLRLRCRNDGKPLKLTRHSYDWLSKWRELRGLDALAEGGDKNSISENISSDEEVQGTQWFAPKVGSGIRISSYVEPRSGCTWKSMMVESDVIRKMNDGSRKFSILYDSDGEKSFESLSIDYDRVVRITGRDELTAPALPAVAFQDGIFYYCSPGCVGKLCIPSLKEEAETFTVEKPLQALGCPVLLIRFYFEFMFQDAQGNTLTTTLKGKPAVDFFNGTTPEQFLRDADLASAATDDLQHLALPAPDGEFPAVEVVIEKKSRRPVIEGAPPVVLYEIVNTRLRRW